MAAAVSNAGQNIAAKRSNMRIKWNECEMSAFSVTQLTINSYTRDTWDKTFKRLSSDTLSHLNALIRLFSLGQNSAKTLGHDYETTTRFC